MVVDSTPPGPEGNPFYEEYMKALKESPPELREITTADLPTEPAYRSEESVQAIRALSPFKLIVTAADLLPKRNPWNPYVHDLKVDIEVIRYANEIEYHDKGRVLYLKGRTRVDWEDDRA
jgi:hypothetical protein